MKEQEAEQALRAILTAMQKMRSNAIEELGASEQAARIRAELMPWTYDDHKTPIQAISTALDLYAAGGHLQPLFVFNMLVVATVLEPAIAAAVELISDGYALPSSRDVVDNLLRERWDE